MKWQAVLAVFLFLATSIFASAQIQVSAQTARTNFLLYERVDVLVSITNISGTDLILSNDEGRPWLSFMVMGQSVGQNYMPVHSERESTFASLTLKDGESKTLRINITPLYSFREDGNYKASAVINLPGAGQMVSDPVPFTILKGHVVTSQLHPVESSERTYSLIRFSPDTDHTKLYLRVVDPAQNTVYTNLALGDLASSVDPEFSFDPAGNVHVLQPTSLGTYLYTRADPDGKVLVQRIFKTGADQIRPRLARMEDGSVIIQGGMEEDPNAPRERLSDSQNIASKDVAAPPPVVPVALPESGRKPVNAKAEAGL